MSETDPHIAKNSEHQPNNNTIVQTSEPKATADSKDSENSKLHIRVSFQGAGTLTALLTLTGNISQPNVRLLRSATNVCLTEKKQFVILDMSNVNVITSAGWGYLVAENVRLSKIGVTLFLSGLQPDLKLLFTDLQLDQAIRSFATIKDCRSAIELIKHHEHKIPEIIKPITEEIPIHTVQVAPVTQQDQHLHPEIPEISLPEKISSMIAKYGPCSFIKILTLLKSEEFGNTKIGLLQLQRTLGSMNLESFGKRERFFRSC